MGPFLKHLWCSLVNRPWQAQWPSSGPVAWGSSLDWTPHPRQAPNKRQGKKDGGALGLLPGLAQHLPRHVLPSPARRAEAQRRAARAAGGPAPYCHPGASVATLREGSTAGKPAAAAGLARGTPWTRRENGGWRGGQPSSPPEPPPARGAGAGAGTGGGGGSDETCPERGNFLKSRRLSAPRGGAGEQQQHGPARRWRVLLPPLLVVGRPAVGGGGGPGRWGERGGEAGPQRAGWWSSPRGTLVASGGRDGTGRRQRGCPQPRAC